jgi:hypothetical protein
VRGPTRILVPVLLVALLAPGVPARAGGDAGPCALDRGDDESVRHHSKRLIACATQEWEVPGGAERAICIADAESHLNPRATSAGGEYLGLFQHAAEAWPARYDAWTRPSWHLDESALSGRTNAIVTIRMVNAGGWGAWSGVGGC